MSGYNLFSYGIFNSSKMSQAYFIVSQSDVLPIMTPTSDFILESPIQIKKPEIEQFLFYYERKRSTQAYVSLVNRKIPSDFPHSLTNNGR